MDEQTAVKRVLAEYEKLLRQSGRIQALEKKLAEGTITMKEGTELIDLWAKAFGKAFSGSVLGIERGSREGACVDLLKDRCADVDELALAAQKAALTRQGLNLTPPTAPFEEERARKIGHSLEDETVPDETIQRRARSATETMLRSQYDRDMKQGAKTCSDAGLRTYIVRDADPGCCAWCSAAAGRYTYGTEPKDVYRRHDNCSCAVVYESGRGKQNVWSKQNWSQEQEQNYLELRDELKAKKRTEAPNVKKPVRLSEKDVQAIMAKVGGLTFGGKSATMYYDHITDFNGSENFSPVTLKNLEKEISVIPDKLQTALSRFVSQIRMCSSDEHSGYSPDTRDIKLNPEHGADSILHELGHALADMRKLYDNEEFISILSKGLDLSNFDKVKGICINKNESVMVLENPKFVTEYQGRVYNDFNDEIEGISPLSLQEYFSEGFKAYYKQPKELQEKDPDLYYFLEGLINEYR